MSSGVGARALRDEGMGRVDQNAREQWKREARAALWRLIRALGIGAEFTTDDVPWPTGTHDNRARGPIMMRAARAGYIEKIGARPSDQPNCHAHPTTIWRVTK